MKQTVCGYLKSVKREFTTKERKPYQSLFVLIPGQKDEFGQPLQSYAGKDKIWKITNFKEETFFTVEGFINKPIKIDGFLNCSQFEKQDGSIDYMYSINAMNILPINTQVNSQYMSTPPSKRYEQEHVQAVDIDSVDDLPF